MKFDLMSWVVMFRINGKLGKPDIYLYVCLYAHLLIFLTGSAEKLKICARDYNGNNVMGGLRRDCIVN